MDSSTDNIIEAECGVDDAIGRIIEIEWEMFDQVQNEGGRADCQDDFRTFFIMRLSQFEAWNADMVHSYLRDLLAARSAGENRLSHKYGYMTAISDPRESERLEEALPNPGDERRRLARALTDRQLLLHERAMKKYPLLAGRGRLLRTRDEAPGETSIETYMLGELLTYSKRTLRLFEAHLDELEAAGKNFVEMNLNNIVRMYGFASIENAEEALRKEEAR
jgi:hypothetical protein